MGELITVCDTIPFAKVCVSNIKGRVHYQLSPNLTSGLNTNFKTHELEGQLPGISDMFPVKVVLLR